MTEDERARVESCARHDIGYLAESALALCVEVRQLREALLACSRPRQFGPCWCDTLAGLYCVGQKQCRAARKALSLEQS
jgi:hypothetical protein